jgi:hypothetical protein
MENKEGKTDNTITISLEDFKLIKAFFPEFERAKGIETNDFVIDWDGLMPVVEKINKIASDLNIRGNHFLSVNGEDTAYTHDKIHEYVCYVMLEQAYGKVVEFIKWYNSNGK